MISAQGQKTKADDVWIKWRKQNAIEKITTMGKG
jgi:hypothetical protein